MVDMPLQQFLDIWEYAFGMADRYGCPPIQEVDLRVSSNYRGITLLSLRWKVYSKVLERRVRLLVGLWT